MKVAVRKILSLLIIFILLMPLLCNLHVDAVTGSGTSSDPWDISENQDGSVTAVYSSGTLTISGTGRMMDWGESSNNAPWYNSYHTTITRVVINSGVTNIGNYAFKNCVNMTTITIPATVTDIGKGAFWDCEKLSSISIPSGITSIRFGTFFQCYKLTQITLPESITSIEDQAFWHTGLTSITIPQNVSSIDARAFGYCSSLTSISVNSSNSYYSATSGVLFNKNKTELVAYPSGKTATTYTIPSTVTSVGDYAFNYNSTLTSITIPSSVTNIGNRSFFTCTNLTSATLPNNLQTIGAYAFTSCSNLISLTIPDGVTSIGEYAFYGCSSISNEFEIPEGVTSIEQYTFYGCRNLTKVTIPETVTDIADNAFYANSSNVPIENLIIRCVENSTAYNYAVDKGIAYELIAAAVTGISLNYTSYTLDKSATNTVQLRETITPSTATTTVTWTSNNTSVATVSSSGLVTAVANGTATITATTANGKTATCSITVQTSPTSVSLNKTLTTLTKGVTNTEQLTATVLPTTANVNKTVTWSSSNTSVATVSSSGLVTAVANGEAIITAKTTNNKTATCRVLVQTNEYTITLDNGNATTNGTASLTEKYGDGIYNGTNKMTTSSYPITTPQRQYTVTYNYNGNAGMPSSRARMTSGLVSGMAEEVTTTSGATSSMVEARCPTWTEMPAFSSSRT